MSRNFFKEKKEISEGSKRYLENVYEYTNNFKKYFRKSKTLSKLKFDIDTNDKAKLYQVTSNLSENVIGGVVCQF